MIFGLTSCQSQNKNEAFWNWFSKNQSQYYEFENNQEKLFDELSARLKEIDTNLVFEFGPIRDNVREFTISADGIIDSFPKVQQLVNDAPTFTNWKINAFRQRITDEDISIKYDDFKISYEDIFFRYSEENGKIGVELNIRNYKDDANYNNAIYLLLDSLLGEYDVETKLSWIDRKQLNESNVDSLYKFVELRKLVDKL
jgi:hypothetical protein